MIKILRKAKKLHETVFMALLAMFCLCASIFRCIYTGSSGFIFLNWNLFLAFIPWALSSLLIIKENIQKYKIAIGIILIFWLLFFPNAPYILTDLLHLRRLRNMPVWYDLLLILSFAWTGLFFGFLSLLDIEKILSKKIKPFYVKIITSILLFIGSFGVYIGRYLRWNSWDIITRPLHLIYDIGERVINPFDHQTTWGLTIFMGIFLNMVYWSLHLIRKRDAR